MGKNTPEMKYSGSTAAFTTAGPASSFGTSVEKATPSEQNDAAPTTSDSATPGVVAPGSSAP